MIKGCVSLASLLVLLGSCGPSAPTAFRDLTPDQYMSMARKELAGGRPLVATALLTDLINRGDDQARAVLLSDPRVKPALIDRIREDTTKLETYDDALRTNRQIRVVRALYGDEVADRLLSDLDGAVLQNLRAGKMVIEPDADTEAFPSLQRPDVRQTGWQTIVSRLAGNPAGPDRAMLHAALNQAATRTPEERAALLPLLERADLSRRELELARPAYPAFAEKRLAALSVRVHLETTPHDRLLLEDLLIRLRVRDGLILVGAGDKADLRVTVAQLRWDLTQLPPRTETVIYRATEVTYFAAFLSMPRDASYAFDRTTGGMQLNYAFEIEAWRGGHRLSDKLLRDRFSEDYVQCSNARILNRFGGIKRADFVANEHMQAACAGQSSASDPDAIRGRIVGRIADEIYDLPAIQSKIGG